MRNLINKPTREGVNRMGLCLQRRGRHIESSLEHLCNSVTYDIIMLTNGTLDAVERLAFFECTDHVGHGLPHSRELIAQSDSVTNHNNNPDTDGDTLQDGEEVN
jgi:hypothetical protein